MGFGLYKEQRQPQNHLKTFFNIFSRFFFLLNLVVYFISTCLRLNRIVPVHKFDNDESEVQNNLPLNTNLCRSKDQYKNQKKSKIDK